MSKSMNSPTARLLRSSRLFSLPRVLSMPALDTTSSGVLRTSDTATLPYPVHQAITTTPASLYRGDFGLKRALPAKKTRRTSTPHVRVMAHDNPEHITPFESAADHTLTEAKWREMGIPIMVKQKTKEDIPRSVYEDDLDITDPDAVRPGPDDTRWKRKGTDFMEMAPGQFEQFVAAKLPPRRAEFREFLVNRIVARRMEAEVKTMRERGGNTRSLVSERTAEVRKEVLASYDDEVKQLRDLHARENLGSFLTSAICDFLDVEVPLSINEVAGLDSAAVLAKLKADSPGGPMTTHPAAGLSFVRTNAIMENHPQYGPQTYRSPVLARVLHPRHRVLPAGAPRLAGTAVGVGGIVAMDNVTKNNPKTERKLFDDDEPAEELSEEAKAEAKMRQYLDADRMSSTLDPDLVGGNKYWVYPHAASIDHQGRINLQVVPAHKESILVKMGRGEEVLANQAAYLPPVPSVSLPAAFGRVSDAQESWRAPRPRRIVNDPINDLYKPSRQDRSSKPVSAQSRIFG